MSDTLMPTVTELLGEINRKIEQPLSLTVGRMAGHELEAKRLLLSDDAADGFRDQCRATRDRIAGLTLTSYATNGELDSGEMFVIDDDDTLAELGAFRRLADSIGSISTIAPRDLDTSIKLYAVAVGDDDRLLFVKQTNPRLDHRAGRMLAVGSERLVRVDGPVFTFSPDFDFVLGPEWAVVLNQPSFERLFRDIGLVRQHIDGWITGITKHLPMTGDSVKQLREVAQRDSRTWRKLREIEKRGHLAQVTLDDVRKYATRVNLDPGKIVVDDQLVFNPADRFSFLHLLNEDLYHGPLTDEVFEAQRKASIN